MSGLPGRYVVIEGREIFVPVGTSLYNAVLREVACIARHTSTAPSANAGIGPVLNQFDRQSADKLHAMKERDLEGYAAFVRAHGCDPDRMTPEQIAQQLSGPGAEELRRFDAQPGHPFFGNQYTDKAIEAHKQGLTHEWKARDLRAAAAREPLIAPRHRLIREAAGHHEAAARRFYEAAYAYKRDKGLEGNKHFLAAQRHASEAQYAAQRIPWSDRPATFGAT